MARMETNQANAENMETKFMNLEKNMETKLGILEKDIETHMETPMADRCRDENDLHENRR